jgi:starch phosphorylase
MTHPAGRIPYLPKRIEGLAAVATNLSWSWNRAAREMFRAIEPRLWRENRHNPIELLHRVEPARLTALAQDDEFLERYDAVMEWLRGESSSEGTWFARAHPEARGRPVAYFCAEFALHNSVPVYSGGLGVLAGDHCKAASDLGVPLVAVGLFYLKGYFDQRLRTDGWQDDSDEHIDPALTPLAPVLSSTGESHLARVRCGDRDVYVGAWRMQVGRVPVYFLDTNLERNDLEDRELSHKLYVGVPELRLRQEWILGVAGVRVLREMGIEPAAWHANEGHAAFMMVERVRELMKAGASFEDAVRKVRATSTFTTHTPVPAGHDMFPQESVERCVGAFWEEMGISREAFFKLGHHPVRDHGLYHMTAVAIRLAGRVTGVSARHGLETRKIWRDLWPERDPAKVPMSHVTNGVHLATWMANPVMDLLDETLGPDWGARRDDPALWERVLTIDDSRLWRVHMEMKEDLLAFMRDEARRRWRLLWGDPGRLAGAGTLFNPAALTIGFARRFATYKRADLLLRDPERLRLLLTNPRRPVQIVFAGKAHPADEPGKQMLQRVYSFTRDPRFEGRIAFLEDYELHLAHRLVQGVDLWLNLPRVPMEACGTSGMKAALNAVPQLSTLDGWWAEGYSGLNGWAIPTAPAGADVDAADAETLYGLLEEQVVPLYYEQDGEERGFSPGWVQVMKQALKTACERFTARRMLQQYTEEYYVPAICGSHAADDPPTA